MAITLVFVACCATSQEHPVSLYHPIMIPHTSQSPMKTCASKA